MSRSADETAPVELAEREQLRRDRALLEEQVKLLVRVEHRLNQLQVERDRELHRIEELNRFALSASRAAATATIHELAIELLLSLYAFEQGAGFRRASERELVVSAVHALPGCEGESARSVRREQRPLPMTGLPAEPLLFDDEQRSAQGQVARVLTERLAQLFGGPPAPRARWLCLPLRGQQSTILGALVLRRPQPELRAHHERLPEDEDRPFLRLVAAHVAAAAQNAMLADIKKAFASKVLEAQELERARVARELHDAIGQMLVAMRMDADWIASHAADAEAVGRVAGQLSSRLGESIVAIRNIVHNLRPPALDDLGVGSALKAYAQQISRLSAVRCEIDLIADPEHLPSEVATAIYRIAQEGLNNVVRHSRARVARLALTDTGKTVRLTVSDDGDGIDAERIDAPTSLGLVGMRERAALLGGELTIHTAPGSGTTLRVEIPYRRARSPG